MVTVRNEERHLPALLDSLATQEGPFEVVLVDAYSDDSTWTICRSFALSRPESARAFQQGGLRGEGRNFGVKAARGEAVAFIDGDCIASPGWLGELRRSAGQRDVVAGRTMLVGLRAFCDLPPVRLRGEGAQVAYPSCNLLYRRSLFLDLGGFDSRLRALEEVDLNYRAHVAGHPIAFAEGALVFAMAADTLFGFLSQAFWQGYGRRQFGAKHPELRSGVVPNPHLGPEITTWRLVRRAAASLGHVAASGERRRMPRQAGG